MANDMKTYKRTIKELESFEANPGYIRNDDSDRNKKTLSALKKCFQLMSKKGHVKLATNKKYDLKDLFIDGFDQEQIWQQIELRNRYVKSYVPVITQFLLNKNDIRFPCLIEQTEEPAIEDNDESDLDLDEENSIAEESGSEEEDSDIEEDGSDVASSRNDPNNDEELPKEREKAKVLSKKTAKKESAVDDDFFKISEMEKFLDEAEKDDLPDDGIDYFEDDISSELDEKNAKYDDFFANPGSEYADQSDTNENYEAIDTDKYDKEKITDKKVKFSFIDDSGESGGEEKTSFEIRESKLRQKIQKLEENNLAEKPWQYKGEIDLSERPVNSLLEEVLDVGLSRRPPPVITETVTNTLEQIIINRIKDSAYDDVERKIKPVHVPHELKKELVLNQEKSKYSLAQVYEQEFLKRKPNEESTEDNDKPDPEKEKILKTMKSLFHKLNVLSNFHYTPKPVTADLEVISNMPAITIEEVTPAAVSDAHLLAPQEVGDSVKKNLMGKEERTKTDKRRERRKKKAFMSHKFKKTSKTENAKISKVLKSRSVDLIKPTQDSGIKSSTSFFKKLQENSEVGKLVKIKKTKHSK